MKRYITSSWSASMGVSTMFGTGKKAIWHFSLSRSPWNKFLRTFESKYEYRIFLHELFSFYEKVPSALDHAGFFVKYFTTTHRLHPEAASGGVLWKKVFLKISQNSQENTCARVTKEIECFQQNIFDRSVFYTSAQSKSRERVFLT